MRWQTVPRLSEGACFRYLWRLSYGREEVTVQDAVESACLSRRDLVNSIIEPTLGELTQRELEYVTAMAQDEVPSGTSDVAARMGVSMTNASKHPATPDHLRRHCGQAHGRGRFRAAADA